MLPLIQSSYFQDLVESFTNGVIIVNSEGEIYVANMAAAHILGQTRHNCVTSTWREVFSGIEDREGFSEFMEEALNTDRCNMPFHTRYKRSDGELLYLNLTTSPLIEFEKVFGILILMNDVSDIYRLHEREKKILEEKNILQKERLDGMMNLSMAVAHQIRNPMTAIGGLANLMLKKYSGNGIPDDILHGIVDASKRLETIVKSVGDFSSITLGETRPAHVEDLVKHAQGLLRKKNEELYVRIGFSFDLEPEMLLIDESLMSRALLELFANSQEAFPGGSGRISVTGVGGDDAYHLRIADNGQGIEEKQLPFVADPFFTTKPMSVGMGLTRAQRAVREHQGRIFIASSPGQGTTVTLRLPAG